MRKRQALLLLLLALLAWKLFRTDWIVSTNYAYGDTDPPPTSHFEVRTYTPPITPLWRPPRPQEIEATATTWLHSEFFYIGGTGGPTEEPRLHVNWPLLVIKLVCGAVAGHTVIVIAFRIFASREQSTGNA